MRFASFAAAMFVLLFNWQSLAQDTKPDTPAAERTRTKLLKVKITVDLQKTPLREALKEFAAQVDMQAERHVMWTYTPDINPDQLVTYKCSDKPLEKVLDEILKAPGLGYVVISDEEHPRDGWVRIAKGAERGYAKKVAVKEPATEVETDETIAAKRLAAAKRLIEGGKAAQAKPVLELITKKYPSTKAATEAKEMLEKLDK